MRKAELNIFRVGTVLSSSKVIGHFLRLLLTETYHTGANPDSGSKSVNLPGRMYTSSIVYSHGRCIQSDVPANFSRKSGER